MQRAPTGAFHRATVILAIVPLMLMSLSVAAAIPGADDPNAYTQHSYYRDRLDFLRRQAVVRYQQIGHRDPSWDEHALTLLDGVCIAMSQASVDYHYRPQSEHPGWGKLVEAGTRAVDAGCEDPLVLDLFAVALHDSDRKAEALEFSRRAVEGILQSQHTPARAAAAIARLRVLIDRKKEIEQDQRLRQLFWDAALASCCSNDLPGKDRRFILHGFWGEFDELSIEQQGEIAQRIKQIEADPWIAQMVQGRYWYKLAWHFRGGGFAHTVTEEGWKGFHENLRKARECFEEAHRLHPEFPEAATQMISVAMGDPQRGAGEERAWFDRAVTAQLDYFPAYRSYLWTLRPRWHGSHQQMYSFGLECAATKRYDTDVPIQLLTALESIRDDRDGDWSFFRRPGVIEAVREVCLAYSQRPDPDDHDYYLARLVGLAWQADRWDIGKSAAEQLDYRAPAASLRAFHMSQVIGSRTISGCYALTGPHATRLRDAERFAAAKKLDQAAKIYQEVAQELPGDDPAGLFVRGRARELLWTRQFEAGEWVDLTPGEHLDGWYPILGEWRVEDGVLVGTTDALGTVIACGLKVGPRFEMICTIDVEAAPPPPGGANVVARAGPVFGLITPQQYYVYTAAPQDQRMTWGRYEQGFKFSARHKAELNPQRNELGLVMADGKFTATANGQIIVRERGTNQFARREDARVGICITSGWPGSVVRAASIRVRRLDRQANPGGE